MRKEWEKSRRFELESGGGGMYVRVARGESESESKMESDGNISSPSIPILIQLTAQCPDMPRCFEDKRGVDPRIRQLRSLPTNT